MFVCDAAVLADGETLCACVQLNTLGTMADEEDSVETGASAAGNGLRGLAYTTVGVLPVVCQLCGVSSDTQSPLASAHELDQYGGLRPWRHTMRHPDQENFSAFKIAKGPICHLCHVVYLNSHWPMVCKTVKTFVKWTSEDVSRHHHFMTTLTSYIEQHNQVHRRTLIEAAVPVHTHEPMDPQIFHRRLGPPEEL